MILIFFDGIKILVKIGKKGNLVVLIFDVWQT
jgi:hypothetical protein